MTEVLVATPKPWYASKTLWANAIALEALAVQLQTGFVVPPEYQVVVLSGVNIALRFVTRRPVVLWTISILILMLGGCAHTLGYAGSHPGYIQCKGKGSITGTGTGYLGAGIGGTEMNSFTLSYDCAEGFTFSQGSGLPPVVPPTPTAPAVPAAPIQVK